MDLDGERYEITILDVSFEGIKLAVPLAIAPGSPIMLHVMNHQIPATVHWYRGWHCGIHLLQRLEGQTLRALENAADEPAGFR